MSLEQAYAGTNDWGLHVSLQCTKKKTTSNTPTGDSTSFQSRTGDQCQINSGHVFKKQLIPAERDYSTVSKVSVWSALLRTGSHETNRSQVEGKSDSGIVMAELSGGHGRGGGSYFREPFICGRQYINLSLITTSSSWIHQQHCFCFWFKGKNQICACDCWKM